MGSEHNARAVLHAFRKTDADARAILRKEGHADSWPIDEGAWTQPSSLSERSRLAYGAVTRIEMARAAFRAGDNAAVKYLDDARELLEAAKLIGPRRGRSTGGANRAKKKREQAAQAWFVDYLKRAYAALQAEGRKKVGRRALSARARKLASIDDVDATRRTEITDDRARQFLERDTGPL